MTKKIITSKDVPGGAVYGKWYDTLRKQNDNPIFLEECPKPYTYLGPVKTNTAVHGWHFIFDDMFFVATYNMDKYTSNVSIYESTKNAEFDCINPIKNFNLYCDIETVVDLFCENRVLEKNE